MATQMQTSTTTTAVDPTIQPFIHQANRLANWNFDWDFSESCQFTKYKLLFIVRCLLHVRHHHEHVAQS